MKKVMFWALCLTLLVPAAALADSYTVAVGYADGLRGGGFFPNPWQGDAGVVFDGFSEGNAFDAGAIKITNSSGGSITVNDVTVKIGSATFDLWGSHVLANGDSLILTQTHDYNFDTSDIDEQGCVNNGEIPTVSITVDGVTTGFTDSGQVLNTSGFDYASCVGNESFQWRPIGGAGGPAGTPEPSSLLLLGTGSLGLLGSLKKRFTK